MAKQDKTKPRPEKTIISLEIYRKRIKLCEATFFKRKGPVFRLLTGEASGDADDISANLANLFKIHKITTKKVFLNIPRHLVMARVFHLPSVNDEEIKSMARMEAVKHMPYRDEDIITGYRVIKKSKDGYSDILLAISQAGTINRLVGILKKAGLTAERVTLSSEALLAWYFAIPESSKKEINTNAALININSEYVDMDICENGNLIFARAFSYEPLGPDPARKIADEIKKSITIYQKEVNFKIDKVFVSGRTDKIKMIESILREEANVSIELVSQGEKIELAENAESALNEASFIGLIGLSLEAGEVRINLLPEKMKEDKEFLSFKNAVRKTLILLGSVILVFAGVITQKIVDKSMLLRALNLRIKSMAPRVVKAKKMREDLKIIKGEIRKKPLAIDVLSEIYKITPRDINFNLLDYESGKSMVLRGNASSLESVVKYIAVLEDSRYFENAKLKYTTKRSRKAAQKTDFEIVCILSKDK